MIVKARLLLILPLVLLPGLGCGKKNPDRAAQVSGSVTYKGNPVTAGTVNFHTSEGVAISCNITPDGTYLGTQLPIGELTVTIETESANKNRKVPAYGAGRAGGGPATSPRPDSAPPVQEGAYVKIPDKYGKKASSGLKVTLEPGKQTHNFELTD